MESVTMTIDDLVDKLRKHQSIKYGMGSRPIPTTYSPSLIAEGQEDRKSRFSDSCSRILDMLRLCHSVAKGEGSPGCLL